MSFVSLLLNVAGVHYFERFDPVSCKISNLLREMINLLFIILIIVSDLAIQQSKRILNAIRFGNVIQSSQEKRSKIPVKKSFSNEKTGQQKSRFDYPVK